jgi:hypothetical protein
LKPVWSFFLLLSVAINICYTVSPEGRVIGNQIEPCPQNQLRIVQEKVYTDPTPGLGTQETPRADGEKDKIYYSIVTPEEEKKTQEEEKEKQDKSWDTLKNIIIDNRRTR